MTEIFSRKKYRENLCEKWRNNFFEKNPVKNGENYMVDTKCVYLRNFEFIIIDICFSGEFINSNCLIMSGIKTILQVVTNFPVEVNLFC